MEQKITPSLWFDGNAEEAIAFYLGIFPDASVVDENRMPEGGPAPAGSLVSALFRLCGQEFLAINGGPQFTFTPAVSFFVRCEDQAEVDRLWHQLLADGGEAEMCGWLRDRFGLSWQIIPETLTQMLGDPDPAKASRVMQAMLQMVKIDVAGLQAAYDG